MFVLGDCPAGWFQIGVDEFKACFLYVGAVTTYTSAIIYCQVRAYICYIISYLLRSVLEVNFLNKQVAFAGNGCLSSLFAC